MVFCGIALLFALWPSVVVAAWAAVVELTGAVGELIMRAIASAADIGRAGTAATTMFEGSVGRHFTVAFFGIAKERPLYTDGSSSGHRP